MTTDRVSDDRLLELIAEAWDPEALALLIGKPEARSAFTELLALREAVKPGVDVALFSANVRNLAAALASHPSPAPAESGAVAWRVKDFADGWVYHTDEARALRLAAHMSGALVQPLYTHPSPAPSAPMGRVREALLAARDLAKTMEALTGCRSDDDYVWGAQAKIEAAIAALDSTPDHGGGEGWPNVDDLAQIIRRVDGANMLGAGELAERILKAIASFPTQESEDGR